MTARQLVGVEQQLFGRVERAALAREDRVFALACEPRVVEVFAAANRNRRVVLLDATFDLGVDLGLERLERLHHRVGVLVLGVEIADDLGVLALGQPVVGVDADLAARLEPLRTWRRYRRGRRVRLIGGAVAEEGEGKREQGPVVRHGDPRL